MSELDLLMNFFLVILLTFLMNLIDFLWVNEILGFFNELFYSLVFSDLIYFFSDFTEFMSYECKLNSYHFL